jgi:HEPN domain-containing protein
VRPTLKSPLLSGQSLTLVAVDADDQVANQRTFDDLMRLFVVPEIERRQATGEAPKPFPLRAAQVLLHPQAGKRTVRLNEEVKAHLGAKLRDGVVKQPGDLVYWHEFADVAKVELAEDDDPDCGHVTMLLIDGRWIVSFDFVYHKATSRKHVDVAAQFFRSAEAALARSDWAAFVDTLFSAAELAAKAWLVLLSDSRFARKTSHREIQERYKQHSELNVEPAFIAALNKLSGWRDRLRYLHGDLEITADEASELLRTVEAMLADARDRIPMRRARSADSMAPGHT